MAIKEVNGLIIDSSVDRMNTFHSFSSPKTRRDVERMLGDQSGKEYTVFVEDGTCEQPVKTVAVGRFFLFNYNCTHNF